MVTLQLVVDGARIGAPQQDVSVILANDATGMQLRSPWPCVTLRLTREQALAMITLLQEGTHGH